jgi:hypothetical protein
MKHELRHVWCQCITRQKRVMTGSLVAEEYERAVAGPASKDDGAIEQKLRTVARELPQGPHMPSGRSGLAICRSSLVRFRSPVWQLK